MDQAGRANRYRFVIAGLTLWAHFGAGLSFQAVSPILPTITDDYGISHTAASLLVGMVLISGVFALPAGVIVGRVGLKLSYTLSWFMMGSMTLAALSPGFGGLLALRVVYGLGMAALFPSTGPLLMQWFRPRELPIITSANIAVMSLGMMISVSTAAPLSGVLHWEVVLGIFGAVGLAGAFAWLPLGRVREQTRDRRPSMAWSEIKAVLKMRTVLLLGAADAACFSMYIALSGWLPTFYHEERGMSLNQAGFVTSILPFMGVPSVLLGGFLTLKIRNPRWFLIVPGAMAGIGGLGSFLVDNTAVIYLSVILFGLAAWIYVPTLLTVPMSLAGMTPQRVAIAWGWVLTASGLAAFVAPLVVGAIRDATDSFIPGFLIFAILAWFLLVAGFILPKPEPRRSQIPVPSPEPSND